ncbi:hypothetical protein D3C74_396530 [compost metagenome]
MVGTFQNSIGRVPTATKLGFARGVDLDRHVGVGYHLESFVNRMVCNNFGERWVIAFHCIDMPKNLEHAATGRFCD